MKNEYLKELEELEALWNTLLATARLAGHGRGPGESEFDFLSRAIRQTPEFASREQEKQA